MICVRTHHSFQADILILMNMVARHSRLPVIDYHFGLIYGYDTF
jgi:hypothetical protein